MVSLYRIACGDQPLAYVCVSEFCSKRDPAYWLCSLEIALETAERMSKRDGRTAYINRTEGADWDACLDLHRLGRGALVAEVRS